MMLQLDDDGVFSKINEEDLIYVDKKELDEFIEEYNHLKKENEQLKSENKKLDERIGILEGSLIDKGFDIND